MLGAIPNLLISNSKPCIRDGGKENYILTQILPPATTVLKYTNLLEGALLSEAHLPMLIS